MEPADQEAVTVAPQPTPQLLREAMREPVRNPGANRTPSSMREASSDTTTTGKTRSRLKAFGSALGFVPWAGVLALFLLASGMVLYVLRGRTAGTLGKDLLSGLGSEQRGYPSLVAALSTAWLVIPIVAGTCIVILVITASFRLGQQLRMRGRWTARGPFGACTYNIARSIAGLGAALFIAAAVWFGLAAVFQATWAVQVWNLSKGSAVAAATAERLAAVNEQFNSTISSLDQTLQANLGPDMYQKVSAAAQYSDGALRAFQPGSVPSGAAPQDGIVATQDMVCPSQACLNLQLYPFLESSSCMCGQTNLLTLSGQAQDARQAASWAAAGTAILLLGCFVGSLDLVSSFIALREDQTGLQRLRRRSMRANLTYSASGYPDSSPKLMTKGQAHGIHAISAHVTPVKKAYSQATPQ